MTLNFEDTIKIDDGYGIHEYYLLKFENEQEKADILNSIKFLPSKQNIVIQAESHGALTGMFRYSLFAMMGNNWYCRPVQ